MEKRAILAIALSGLILFAFKYYEDYRMAQMPRPRTPATERQVKPAEIPETPAGSFAAQESAPSAPSPETAAVPKTLRIRSELYQAVLDNRGALVTSWELQKYKSANDKPFEMIPTSHDPESRPYPGSLVFDNASVTETANSAPYELQVAGGDTGGVLQTPVTVTARLTRGDLSIEKTWRFEKDNYLADVKVTAAKGGKPLAYRFLVGQDIGPEYEHLVTGAQLQAVAYRDGKVRRDAPPEDPSQTQRIDGDIRWAGLDMHYFAIVAVPPKPIAAFEIQRRPVKAMGLDGKQVDRDLLRLQIPAEGVAEFRTYLGPKAQPNLQAVGAVELTGVVDYGMFSVLVLPLLYSLKWIYQYVHNYGYAIILLTLLLTLLLFPFRLKQMVSMKRMQVVQPKIKAIQEKYKKYKKTDPKRAEMNQEVMAVYKEHNVNPLGGCLPLLLQMPLLFAFYSLLAYSIELRQAPFMLWVHDLSAKDPYYVLPIIMGITMVISQKMTPMTPGSDPMQAKMMTIMPAIFTLMFLNVSSGLNLYFLFSNIFQIAFQKIAERWVGDGKSSVKS